MADFGDHRFEGHSLETKVGWIKEGAGTTPMQDGQDGLRRLGQALIDAEELLSARIRELDSEWEGGAASEAGGAMRRLAFASGEAGDVTSRSSEAVGHQAQSSADMRNRMPEVVPEPSYGVNDFMGDAGNVVTLGYAEIQTNYDHEVERRRQAEAEANAALTSYQSSSRASASLLRPLDEPPALTVQTGDTSGGGAGLGTGGGTGGVTGRATGGGATGSGVGGGPGGTGATGVVPVTGGSSVSGPGVTGGQSSTGGGFPGVGEHAAGLAPLSSTVRGARDNYGSRAAGSTSGHDAVAGAAGLALGGAAGAALLGGGGTGGGGMTGGRAPGGLGGLEAERASALARGATSGVLGVTDEPAARQGTARPAPTGSPAGMPPAGPLGTAGGQRGTEDKEHKTKYIEKRDDVIVSDDDIEKTVPPVVGDIETPGPRRVRK